MKRQASWVLTAFLLLVISACGNTEESAFLNKKTPLKAREHISIEKTFYNENAICLENTDSTKTLYLYSSPLYYQDDRKKEHVLIDNSLNDNEDNDAFFNTFNDIQCFLPTSLSSKKPILLKKSYSEMKIYLQTKESKKGKKYPLPTYMASQERGYIIKTYAERMPSLYCRMTLESIWNSWCRSMRQPY